MSDKIGILGDAEFSLKNSAGKKIYKAYFKKEKIMELKEFIAQTMKGISDGFTESENLGVKIVRNNYNDIVL